jgi:RNA polymerase sigma factor (sigma-70 family)
MATRPAALLPLLTRPPAATNPVPVTDRDLLRRFARDKDEAAFAILVQRHGPMVVGVCRRVLGNPADADDAFQATFLVLARKAGTGRWRPSVASWLYATARQVALNARTARSRRARHEGRATAKPPTSPLAQISGEELLAILDEELGRLPERYRAPVVLCCVEGLTRDEAAHQLGVPAATLKGQLERGRKRLHDALARRGVALGSGLLALAATTRSRAVSPQLVEGIRAAARGRAPSNVITLAEGVTLNGVLKKAVLGVAVAAVLAAGVGGRQSSAGPQPDRPPVKATGDPRPPVDELALSGRVVDADGKPVAGTTVRVVPWAGKWARFDLPTAPAPTDRDGRYDLRVLADRLIDPRSGDEARPVVVATVPGYFPGWTAVPSDGRIVLAKADTKAAGRITDLEGKPLAGVTVTVTAVAGPTGESLDRWVEALRRDREGATSIGKLGPAVAAEYLTAVSTSARTDAAGRFELAGYASDRVLYATVAGPGIATSTVGLVTRDLGPAALPGPAGLLYYGTDGVIASRPSRPITGVVRDRPTGKPIAGATVQSLTMAGRAHLQSGLVTTTTDKEGRFLLNGMPKGAGNSLLVVPGRGQPYLIRGIDVPDPSGVDPVSVDVPLERGIPIEGVVRDPAGRPVPNAHVAYLANRFNDRVPRDGFGARSGATEPTDADGRFRVVGLPGTGYLVAVGPGRDYVAATERAGDGSSDTVRLDTVASPARANQFHAVYALDVPRTAVAFRQDVVLERGTSATVTVVDPDGEPVAGCRALWSRAGDDWRDEFRLGEHRVEGLNPKRPRTVLIRHVDRNLVGAWTPAVGPHLTLRPGVMLTGRVLSDDGRPRAGVSVSVFVRPSPENSGDAQRYRHPDEKIVTDAAGRFRVPALAPGFTYEVSINGQFVANSTVELDARATGAKDVGDLRLRLADDR